MRRKVEENDRSLIKGTALQFENISSSTSLPPPKAEIQIEDLSNKYGL